MDTSFLSTGRGYAMRRCCLQNFMLSKCLVNKFDSDFKNEMKVGGGCWLLILSNAHQSFSSSGQRSVRLGIAFSDYNSKGLADQTYCETLETEVPNTVQYLLDRKQAHRFNLRTWTLLTLYDRWNGAPSPR